MHDLLTALYLLTAYLTLTMQFYMRWYRKEVEPSVANVLALVSWNQHTRNNQGHDYIQVMTSLRNVGVCDIGFSYKREI